MLKIGGAWSPVPPGYAYGGAVVFFFRRWLEGGETMAKCHFTSSETTRKTVFF